MPKEALHAKQSNKDRGSCRWCLTISQPTGKSCFVFQVSFRVLYAKKHVSRVRLVCDLERASFQASRVLAVMHLCG